MRRQLMWLIPDGNNELLWDHRMCDDTGLGAALRELIAKAFKGPLSLDQQEQVSVVLAGDPQLVYCCGITPGKLQELVENNPTIAAAILIYLRNSAEISEYFEVLVNMDTSLYSLEVVSRLTTAVEVPTDFLHRYIKKCISFCEKIEENYMQKRLVRLVSVFLQSLIRNKCDLQAIVAEVREFCRKFPKIKEASSLNSLLKT
ncbi:CCR4-NOT transcription complex subunit 11-like [Iris pallida]|uniref:CCR4-NOT transcription complex subunit 11 n=1 Tax=Iris pallida TaxID=29817 RepID=A0AAX6IGZ2_IRIPA|nr:CCR4-NOT transcription complex subunit 11-like [Iris pallida]